METSDLPDFDMAMPLTTEQAERASELMETEPQAWWSSISCLFVIFLEPRIMPILFSNTSYQLVKVMVLKEDTSSVECQHMYMPPWANSLIN